MAGGPLVGGSDGDLGERVLSRDRNGRYCRFSSESRRYLNGAWPGEPPTGRRCGWLSPSGAGGWYARSVNGDEDVEPQPELCDLCGTVVSDSTEWYALVPDSSSIHAVDAKIVPRHVV